MSMFQYEPIIVKCQYNLLGKLPQKDNLRKKVLGEVMTFGFQRGYSWESKIRDDSNGFESINTTILKSKNHPLKVEFTYTGSTFEANGTFTSPSIVITATLPDSEENRFGDYVYLRDLLSSFGKITNSNKHTYEAFLGIISPKNPLKKVYRRFVATNLLFDFGMRFEDSEKIVMTIADEVENALEEKGLNTGIDITTENLSHGDYILHLKEKTGNWVLDILNQHAGENDLIEPIGIGWDDAIGVDFNIEKNFGDDMQPTYEAVIDVLSGIEGMKRAKYYKKINGKRQPTS